MSNEHNHNHEEEDRYITLVNENGDEELFEILLTFDSEEYEKSYVLFYPVGEAEDEDEDGGTVHAYAYIPTEDGGLGELLPIETDEEWEMIEEVFNTFVEDEEEQ
ncbi:DUF1292 domain-containing protein [Bacillus sp. BRMEA1]|uniref:DUF1292 domain-containing protein n=1 Tax=Neobacillus endophyticus TaxID=2738405 RepID=UPI001567109D|nr:DUF1292 domain-containing protein [Neobacillus endophyticus]NRD75935.1 DUF1292 domain-containing protein [Neobacillus endophyticus]